MSDPVVFEHDWRASEMALLPRAAAAAASECVALGLPADLARTVVRVTLCQLVQESGLGRSENAKVRNNFYGAMAGLRVGRDVEKSTYALGQSVLQDNREIIGGRSVIQLSPFYTYRSLEDSTRDHVRYITGRTGLSIYANPPADFTAFCDWLCTPPRTYATEPTYPDLLKRIDARFTMSQYVEPALRAVTAPGPSRPPGLLARLRDALSHLGHPRTPTT